MARLKVLLQKRMPHARLHQDLFLRYYGDACSPEQRKKILAAIADY
jgi:hypothetical protein